MATIKSASFLLALLCLHFAGFGQSDTSFVSKRAMQFADSLIKAYHYSNWTEYLDISHPGVIQYYGGSQGFRDYSSRMRAAQISSVEKEEDNLQLVQLASENREWQCVVKQVRHTEIDGKKATIVSYLVGQSKDAGQNWKYFDVAYNSVENVIYIMPDIFDTLAIPRRQIIFDKEEIARQ